MKSGDFLGLFIGTVSVISGFYGLNSLNSMNLLLMFLKEITPVVLMWKKTTLRMFFNLLFFCLMFYFMSNDQTKRKVEYRNVGIFDDFLGMGQNWLFGLNSVIPPEGRQQTTFFFL